MTAWQRLGIEPTDNQREIKKAYAKQLKLIDQDTQPEEFILLREALETAQFEAENLIYENEDLDNSSSIFEENNSFNDQNLNSDDLNDQTLENKLKRLKHGEFKHEVRQFEKSYDNQQAEQISLMV